STIIGLISEDCKQNQVVVPTFCLQSTVAAFSSAQHPSRWPWGWRGRDCLKPGRSDGAARSGGWPNPFPRETCNGDGSESSPDRSDVGPPREPEAAQPAPANSGCDL